MCGDQGKSSSANKCLCQNLSLIKVSALQTSSVHYITATTVIRVQQCANVNKLCPVGCVWTVWRQYLHCSLRFLTVQHESMGSSIFFDSAVRRKWKYQDIKSTFSSCMSPQSFNRETRKLYLKMLPNIGCVIACVSGHELCSLCSLCG